MSKQTPIKAHDDPVRYTLERMLKNGTATERGTAKAALKEWDDLRQACMEATGHSYDWRVAFAQWLGEGGERAALGDFFNGWELARQEHKAIDKRWPLIRRIITDSILDQLPALGSKITQKAMQEVRRAFHALDDACAFEDTIREIGEATDGEYHQLMLDLFPQGAKNEQRSD